MAVSGLPPTGLTPTSGNGVVQLDWTESATPSTTTQLYRRRISPPADPNFSLLDTVGQGVTTYQDSTVDNAREYIYYAVSIDPEGFDSSWSDFNDGCAEGTGTDCVLGQPLNDVPPSVPQGLTVSDPGLGDLLRISWNPNPEPDIGSYTVSWGTTPGVYTDSLVVDESITSTAATNLQEGVTYFVTVVATNTSGFSSDPAQEVDDFPVLAPPGLRPPAFVDTLRLEKSGDDVLLTFTAVTTDIYGKPLATSGYELFQGDGTVRLSNGDLSLVDTCADPCVGLSFTDLGGLLDGTDSGYRVRAIGADGQRGALGVNYPNGPQVRFEKSLTPGNLRLEWDPVNSTVDGVPTTVPTYEVWQADFPFNRQDIEAGVPGVTLVVVQPETFLELTDPGVDRYYSILAIDDGGNRSPF